MTETQSRNDAELRRIREAGHPSDIGGLQTGAKLKVNASSHEIINQIEGILLSQTNVVWKSDIIRNDREPGYHQFLIVAGGVLDDQ